MVVFNTSLKSFNQPAQIKGNKSITKKEIS